MDISWMDFQNEIYFFDNDNGGIRPSPLLTHVRFQFTKFLLENPSISFVIPNHGLIDYDVISFQSFFHREKDTFHGFVEDDLDQNLWFAYNIIPERNLEMSSQLSSIIQNGLIYLLNGFSIFSPISLSSVPKFTMQSNGCVIRLHSLRTPQPFSMKDIQLIQLYLYSTVMGLPKTTLSPYFFIFPLFMRTITTPNFSCSVLTPHQVLIGLLDNIKEIVSSKFLIMNELVYNSINNPKVLRVDQIDLNRDEIIHSSFTSHIICSELFELESLSKLWSKYLDEYDSFPKRLRYLYQEFVDADIIQNRSHQFHKLNVDTISLSIQGFKHTGLFPDLSMGMTLVLPLVHHIRYHLSLPYLQQYMNIHFKDPLLLECCLTHSSFKRDKPKLGIPPALLQYSLSKTGTLKNSHFFSSLYKHTKRTNSECNHLFTDGDDNERLEFLGDAVIELLTTVSLFHIFPDSSEGPLSIFRSAIVQNCHLGHLASQIFLTDFLLLDIPNQSPHDKFILKTFSADALESIFGALFLEQSLSECQKLLGRLLWSDNLLLNNLWNDLPQYPAITWSKFMSKVGPPSLFDAFEKLKIFEQSIGINFLSKNLLAKAFSQPSIPFNIYTCGSNSALEFLGDSILQFVVSKYLFINVPQVEGILSSLRSTIVNNRTLSLIGEELKLSSYVILQPNESVNDYVLADVFESLIAVIYLDRGMNFVDKFCEIIFFKSSKFYPETNPKLTLMIYCNKLSHSSFISYELLDKEGPSNNTRYTVGVYLGSQCLATGVGITRKVAEANAAREALNNVRISRKTFILY